MVDKCSYSIDPGYHTVSTFAYREESRSDTAVVPINPMQSILHRKPNRVNKTF